MAENFTVNLLTKLLRFFFFFYLYCIKIVIKSVMSEQILKNP